VRPLDRLLVVARLALVPLFLLVASLPAFGPLSHTLAIVPGRWLPELLAACAAITYVFLLQTPTVGGRIDRLTSQARRRVATACNPSRGNGSHSVSLSCRLTPDALRVPVFRYDEQRDVVSQLLDAFEDEQTGRYWFVVGDSGTGKTRSAFLLVQALTRDDNLFELADRCLLYDFAASSSTQIDLLRRLGTSRHADAVVLVDNFELVEAGTLQALTARLVDVPGQIRERAIVFLARPGAAWNLSPGWDVRLVSEARSARRVLTLPGSRVDAALQRVADIDEGAARELQQLADPTGASASQLHIAQVIVGSGCVPSDVDLVLSLLLRRPAIDAPLELVSLLAVVAALAVHRGSFSRGDLLRGVGVASRSEPALGGKASRLRLLLAARRFSRIGLLARVDASDVRYTLHESFAELLVDRLFSSRTFRVSFDAVCRSRLAGLLAQRDAGGAWLMAAETGDQDVLQATFDAAVATSGYEEMARTLKRASERYELSPAVRLQLAILLDRTGAFDESRCLLSDDLAEQLSEFDELAAILTATRFETSHSTAAELDIDKLRHSPDRRIAIVGDYWHLHIAGHRGKFAAESLLNLACEALQLSRERESHWLTYSLSRMHFDSLRHQYLEGGLPPASVFSPRRQELGDYLRRRLPSYEGLQILYTQAHLVSHVLLPQLAIFGQPVEANLARTGGLAKADLRSQWSLAAKAEELYAKAIDAFWQYGDREAQYLQADVLNASMQRSELDLDPLWPRLVEYERFIRDTGFPDLASYPSLYFFRWHLLKYYAVLREAGGEDVGDADYHLVEASRQLHMIIARDSASGNRYGLLRARVLEALLAGVRAPLDVDALGRLQKQACRRRYGFERRLLARLIDVSSVTPSHLQTIVRFYPFVHQ
jgi:hypothetical protein